ncbi:MAG: serine hydrolase [Acidobacteria bacterium]|nr:serine hydrolase [Acidobacteriota bacterium]MBV9478121.1 serine hydrolase [Acidobacteriota bacterium]
MALALSCCIVAGNAFAAADAPDPRAARVDALFARYDRTPSPGLALAVVRDGKVLLRRGYGLASLEHNVRITPETAFDIASLSKQFTGLAMAMLVEEGKVRLDDDVRTYLPELQLPRPITIEQLLHHTSGIRDWAGTLAVAGWSFDDVISFRQILDLAFHQRTLNFAPGAEHLYSNTGYNLLAEIIQRVTKQPFPDWMRAHIFAPLGMSNTRVRAEHTEVVANRAYGYANDARGTWHVTPDNLTAYGSSSMFSTVDDLARWLINFGDAKVGGASAIARMRTPGRLTDGTTTPYGFGILGGTYRGLTMFTHSGGWASFDTYDVWFPDQKFGIVVLANGESIDAQAAIIKIADIYLADELAPNPPATAEAATPPPAPHAIPRPAPPSPAQLAAYAGTYESDELQTTYRITIHDGALELHHNRLGNVTLTFVHNDEFTTPLPYLASLVFERGADGSVQSLRVNGSERSRDIRFSRRA